MPKVYYKKSQIVKVLEDLYCTENDKKYHSRDIQTPLYLLHDRTAQPPFAIHFAPEL